MSNNEGWICPKCKTVHNPSVKKCNCQKKNVAEEQTDTKQLLTE